MKRRTFLLIVGGLLTCNVLSIALAVTALVSRGSPDTQRLDRLEESVLKIGTEVMPVLEMLLNADIENKERMNEISEALGSTQKGLVVALEHINGVPSGPKQK